MDFGDISDVLPLLFFSSGRPCLCPVGYGEDCVGIFQRCAEGVFVLGVGLGMLALRFSGIRRTNLDHKYTLLVKKDRGRLGGITSYSSELELLSEDGISDKG